MSHLFRLEQEDLMRIRHIFPKPHGVARSEDGMILGGIILVIHRRLGWRDASAKQAPHKTL